MKEYDKTLFEVADMYDLLLEMCEKYAQEYEYGDGYYYDDDDDDVDDRQTPEEYKRELLGDLKRGEQFVLARYLGNDEEVWLPDGIHSIKAAAFSGNKALRKVHVPDSVLRIANQAFSACTALEEVQLGKNIDAFGISVFKGCTSLKSIVMPDSLRLVGSETFSGCTSLREVHLSEKLNAIPVEMFKNCTSLRSIKIPDNVEVIRIYAFDGCASLEKVQFGQKQKLTAIGWDAFARCTSLKSVEFPDGLKNIDQAVFYDSGLEEVYFPASVEYISPSAFSGCYTLKKVEVHPNNPHYYSRNNCIYEAENHQILVGRNDGTVPNDGSLKYIGYSAYECNLSLTEFDVPNGVTQIDIAAFMYCKNLRRVTLPTTLERIDRCAFEGTALEEVTIPRGVMLVDDNSFSFNNNLKRVIFKRGVEKVGSYAFAHCPELQEVYIPASVKRISVYSAFGECKRSMRVYLEKGAEGEYVKELKEKFDVITDYESAIFD